MDGEESYEPVTTIKVKDSVKNLFLYLHQEKERVNVIPVDTSLSKFPRGHFCFINSINKDLILRINDRAGTVKPKSQVVVKYKLGKSQLLRLEVQSKNNSKKNLSVISVSGREGQRIVGFFYQMNNGRSHRILIERGVDSQAKHIIKK